MPLSFRFRWIPGVATLAVAAAGIMLGQWQTRRADDKVALQHRLETRATLPPLEALPPEPAVEADEFRHIRLSGEFIPRWTVYLENRPLDGAAGFHVLTPFKMAPSSQIVMVARGWAPRDPADRAHVPSPPTPAGVTTIDGVLRRGAGQVLQLGRADPPKPGAILQNLDLDAFAAASRLPVSGYVIEQLDGTENAGDGLVHKWPSPSLGIERHRAYAVQWYALAAMAVLFFLVTGFRRARHDKS